MLAVNEVRAMLTDAVEATVLAGIPEPAAVAAALATTGGVGRFWRPIFNEVALKQYITMN